MIKDITRLRGGCYVADFRYDEGFRIRQDGISPCLRSDFHAASNSLFIIEVIDEDQKPNEEVKEIRIRKLTPKECFRLQGWADDYYGKAEFVNVDSQLYKQAGNGVTVNVIYEIAKRLKI